MYTPILDQIKRELKKHFQRANIDDLDNCIYSMFSHLLWMYKPQAESKMSLSMWLKRYLKGWCYRFMNDLMGTGKKSGMVLAAAIRDSDIEGGSYTDIVGATESEETESGDYAKDKTKIGIEYVRLWCGDKSADALFMKHVYKMTQSEIAEILGCTQAKVSKILVDAEQHFKKSFEEEEEEADAFEVPEDNDGEGERLYGP